MEKLRVLELFCGMGGLHWALKEIGIPFEIIGALEINPTVLEIYGLNFPEVPPIRRNITSLTPEEINEMGIDAIVMSPPCQPFCRMGKKQGLEDNRSSPLSHLLEIFPKIQFKYLFVENVQGFETSDARGLLLEVLGKCGFHWHEFLLSPLQFGIPNSRLRYYLIGKHSKIKWSFEDDGNNGEIRKELPRGVEGVEIVATVGKKHKDCWLAHRDRRRKNLAPDPEHKDEDEWVIDDLLESPLVSEKYHLCPEKYRKYEEAVDIVKPNSKQSCCFTKAYFHYLTGTGSILEEESSDENNDKHVIRRYFTPKEVSRLLCYPEELQFPPQHSPKQCYKALGNSVNVHVVALMFALLFS